MSEDYRWLNRASWDEPAPAHAASPDCAVERFRADPTFLSHVVRFDLQLLGSVDGQRGVHLQCHIGTDTVSLSRLGARMIGLDFSPAAVEQARAPGRRNRRGRGVRGGRRLRRRAGPPERRLRPGLHRHRRAVLASGHPALGERGAPAAGWRWASVVRRLLAPGGRLFLRESHPMLWELADPGPDGRLVVEHAYFEREEPTVWDEGGTYVATDAVFEHNVTHEWHHGLGEIVTALLDEGLQLTGLVEHDSVPYQALPGLMQRLANGEWRLADRPWRLAHSYTLQAVHPDTRPASG